MKLPWLQLDDDFLSATSRSIAARLGVSRHEVIGMATDLIAHAIDMTWSKERPPDGVFMYPEAAQELEMVMGWTGEKGRAFEIFVQACVIQKLEIGCRVRGMERYASAWKNRLKPKPDKSRTGVGTKSDRNRTDLGCGEGEGDRDIDHSSSKNDLRGERPFELEEQDAREKPKRPNPSMEAFERFQAERARFLKAPPQKLVKTKKRDEFAIWARFYSEALQALGGDSERLFGTWKNYLQDEWGLTRTPQCPWQGFVTENVFQRCIPPARLTREHVDHPPETPAEGAWQAVLSEIKASDRVYAAEWLSKLQAVNTAAGGVTVRASDKFMHDWVLEHYGGLLEEFHVTLEPITHTEEAA